MLASRSGALNSHDRDIPRYTETTSLTTSSGPIGISRVEHQTVLIECPIAGRTLNWIPEAPFGVRCTAGYLNLRIKHAY